MSSWRQLLAGCGQEGTRILRKGAYLEVLVQVLLLGIVKSFITRGLVLRNHVVNHWSLLLQGYLLLPYNEGDVLLSNLKGLLVFGISYNYFASLYTANLTLDCS